jgi:hypothetical protein
MPENPGNVVYGTILIATLLSAEFAKRETYLKTVGAVIIAMIVYWVSIAYSNYTGERLKESEHFEYAAFARFAGHESSVLYGGVAPLLVILGCWVGGAALSAALSAAIFTAVGVVVVIEVGLGIRADLPVREVIRQTAVGIVLGVLVIALRVLWH